MAGATALVGPRAARCVQAFLYEQPRSTCDSVHTVPSFHVEKQLDALPDAGDVQIHGILNKYALFVDHFCSLTAHKIERKTAGFVN